MRAPVNVPIVQFKDLYRASPALVNAYSYEVIRDFQIFV